MEKMRATCKSQLFLFVIGAHLYAEGCIVPIGFQCEGQDLDLSREFCCGNRTVQKYDQLGQKQCCCIDDITGREETHTTDKICCGGRLHDSHDNQQRCCGATVYNVNDDKLCCDPSEPFMINNSMPILHQIRSESSAFMECCGNEVIDVRFKKCCPSEHYEVYRNVTSTPIEGDPFNWYCCGLQSYNDLNHVCRTDSIGKKRVLRQHQDLCNDDVQCDTTVKLCCGGVIHDKNGTNQICCGKELMNNFTHRCCDDDLMIDINRQCCGSHPQGFQPHTERCCGKPLTPYHITDYSYECCGNGVYDNKTEVCCQGQKFSNEHCKVCRGSDGQCTVVGHHDSCCGPHQLHPDEVCCANKFTVQKNSSAQDKCCEDGVTLHGQPYNSATEMCDRGRVVPKVQGPVCKYQTYNDTTDICCNYQVYPNAILQGFKCCPNKGVYDSKTQSCCNADIVNDTRCPEGKPPSSDPLCRDLCTRDRRHVRNQILQARLNICRDYAYVAEVNWQIVGYVKNINIYYFRRKPQKNLFSGKCFKKRLGIRHRYLYLPCTCQKNFKKIIVITSKPQSKKKVRLNRRDGDVILPYSQRIKTALLQTWKTHCKSMYSEEPQENLDEVMDVLTGGKWQ